MMGIWMLWLPLILIPIFIGERVPDHTQQRQNFRLPEELIVII
ncbi:hypothetical protein OMAG_000331 [Candidatus Omnitrophus magneticus]|uniref:Uncharacterized protein n=1 Tax=Candidatus Omnitrophus magneticus TaxID=1609969 RepID=A0A0F0CUU9_9BACT|nr:hypothetical protein OMAG_000331 [Candidatus Omnitrophus magneticus]